MAKSVTKLKQLTRNAATALFFPVSFIMGFCFLWLALTVWNQSEPVGTEPFYSTLPGVNMEHLPPVRRHAVLQTLNVQRCHCECMRSVASCRNHHYSCTESIVAAQDEVNAAKGR